MALNFPNNPSVGDIHEDSTSGFSFQWDGTFWKSYRVEISDSLGGNLDAELNLNSNDITGTGNINITGAATFSGNVSVGGTLTYEDVTNVDSIGIITARSDVSIADKIVHTGDTDTAIRFPAADTFTVETGGSERMRIDSSGQIDFNSNSRIEEDGLFKSAAGTSAAPSHAFLNDPDNGMFRATTNTLAFATAGTERLRIDSSGNVGIGEENPSVKLHLKLDTNKHIRFQGNIGEIGSVPGFQGTTDAGALTGLGMRGSDLRFATGSSERMRIDSSGRLLVGTSSARSNFGGGSQAYRMQLEGDSFANAGFSVTRNTNDAGTPSIIFAKSRSTGNSVIVGGDPVGSLYFEGNDGSNFIRAARIAAFSDGTPGTNDMPGRLVFYTTPDNESSPIERMRIDRSGLVTNKTSGSASSVSTTGWTLGPQGSGGGYIIIKRNGSTPFYVNRGTNDGILIDFWAQDTQEGSISVSGTTVSYNGAHLSRWSQLPSGAERTEILRGSVLSNLDEMCEWGDEDNEQLNRMQVSDVEGDCNVAGVFQAWDDDDDTYTNDFYCAMTGDFVIRIAQGTTVTRGDLLMSAGDGTAKPQDDDIVRSKTIAKVTSTVVSETYSDGSYCVPCVLMAC